MYKHILIPIALDHEHHADEALTVAGRLLADGGRISAIHVVEPLPGFAAQYIPEETGAARQEELRAKLREELGAAEAVTPVVIEGHAGRGIVDYAAENGVDCIVIASHRPGFQDFFLGSTAARVVRHAQCCVHVLR